jgi:hypothetical protein
MDTCWSRLGNPDFATCGKLFYRLPAELRESLNRSEEKVLIWTLFLVWYQTFHSGRQSSYASFSEERMGKNFGRSRWTVGRALEKLQELALVRVTHRRPRPDGVWQTNLYSLGARLSAALARVIGQVRDFAPCSKNAPQESQKSSLSERRLPLEESPRSREGKDTGWREFHKPASLPPPPQRAEKEEARRGFASIYDAITKK